MTSMPHLVAVAEATDDSAAELVNLRSAYAAACAELIEVRRQRDEAIANGQELLARLIAADEQQAAIDAVPCAAPAAESIQVAPAQPLPVQVSPIPTILEPTPVAVAEVAPVVESTAPAPVELAVVAEPVGSAVEVEEPVAPPVTRWLPPEEETSSSSFAHEFAALSELSPDAVEDAPAPAQEPLSSPMNVLPTATAASKQSIWRRKIQIR